MSRIRWVDIAKGIGIILVTMGHTRISETPVNWWLTSFHMPLFYFLAGLCFDENRYPSYGQYFIRKCIALGYPYVMLSIVVAALISTLYFGDHLTVSGVWKGALRGNPFAPMWFISSLFAVELLFGAMVRFVKSGWGRLLISLLLAAIGWQLSLEMNSGVWTGWDLAPVTLFSVLFYNFGWMCRTVVSRVQASRYILPATVCCFLAQLGAMVLEPHGYVHVGLQFGPGPLWYVPLALIGTIFVCLLSIMIDRFQRPASLLQWFGRNSIILLVLHECCGHCGHSWGLGVWIYPLEYGLLAILTYLIAGPCRFLIAPDRKSRN